MSYEGNFWYLRSLEHNEDNGMCFADFSAAAAAAAALPKLQPGSTLQLQMLITRRKKSDFDDFFTKMLHLSSAFQRYITQGWLKDISESQNFLA